MTTTSGEFAAFKARLKSTWMDGDYATFAQYLRPGALEILAGWRIQPGQKMLDIGCGAGQIAIPAASIGIDVTGIDIATNLIEHARAEAQRVDVKARFDEGDAEDLPYPDASFDAVVSMVGAMFAPQPDRVAAEMLRVCRPGGRILMVNWTPQSFVADMFRAITKYVPPPQGVPLPPPAVLWGDEATVRQRFGDHVGSMQLERRLYPSFDFPFGPVEVAEWFLQLYGPTKRAYEAVAAERGEALRADLVGIFSKFNRASDGTTSLAGEYLNVDAVRA